MDYNKIFIKDAQPTKIGGQAVMEGVMMRGRDREALAVRLPNGTIKLEINSINSSSRIKKIPFIRGIVSFFESLISGTRTLMRSADILEEAMPENELEESGKFEEWLNRRFGEKGAWNAVLVISLFISILITLIVFVIFPTFAVNILKRVTNNSIFLNLAEGVLRLGIFLVYVWAISKMNDIKRLFQYHGAEHKTIHCYENGLELTPENASEFYTLHPRCGTSFLMFVLIVSLILFSFLGWPNLIFRILSRILLMPVIAGISYELLRLAGKKDNAVVKIISWPGLMMQKMTTNEPDFSQLEVAIAALKGVLREENEDIGGGKAAEITDKEEEESIFKELENKRFEEDSDMVKNIVREGRKILQDAGIDNPKGDADDIFCYITGFKHSEIITRNTEILKGDDAADYRAAIARRASGMPLQYITKVQEFMGLLFRVNENVLIPRLDTEVLVDQVIGIIKGFELENPRILDLCTGSGVIGITIAHEISGSNVVMSDISDEALRVAQSNAEINNVTDRVKLVQGNMFSALAEDDKFNLIVSNPPYIKSDVIDTLAAEVREHEPRLALDGGEDGLNAYRVIALNAANHLEEGGLLALEIGYDQGEAVVLLLERTKFYKPAVIVKDLVGKNRVVLAEKAERIKE